MILLTPLSRVCVGKSTKYPVTEYLPLLWIKPQGEKYTVVNIDGFIIDKNHSVNGIFKKAEFISEFENEEFTPESIFQLITQNEFKVIKSFASTFETDIHTFIWPKDFPTRYSVSDKLIYSLKFDFKDAEIAVSSVKKISLQELEKGISILRGFSFKNVKNLNSSSSNVECYLANNTTNPWPGDLDAIIFDNTEEKFIALLEFKTHNIDTPIENEHIGKYGQEDWRRFDVLFDLIDNFQAKLKHSPKLFFIVWGTNLHSKNHRKIKVDLLQRNKILRTEYLDRPAFNEFSENLFSLLIEMSN